MRTVDAFQLDSRAVVADGGAGRKDGIGRLPNFLIIGAPRSGTTALATYLGAHPGVFMSAEKELQFFNDPDYTVERIPWYCQQFAGAAPDQVAGEASPLYLFTPEAAERMREVVPNAKLVATLRHPIDRAWSHYWFRRLWRVEHRSLAEAVNDDLGGRALPGAEYVAIGRYAEQLDRLERYFPSEHVLVLLLDELIRDPVLAFRRVCRFLEIDDRVVPDVVGSRMNTTYDLRSPKLWNVTAPHRRRLGLLGAIARRLDVWNAVLFKQPDLDPELRSRLLEHYAVPNTALEERLGVELADWRR